MVYRGKGNVDKQNKDQLLIVQKKSMRHLLTVTALLIHSLVSAQTNLFVDPRDNNAYQTIVIGNKIWFRENLRFQTSKSFCPNFNKNTSDCRDGNYYSNSEVQSICPQGWHVATIREWEEFFSTLLATHHINNGTWKYDSSANLPDAFSVRIDSIDLLKDTLLNLVATGWVEGLQLKKNGGLSLWIIDTTGRDDKYHLHLGKNGFVKHSHEHHIMDKPKKIRKFPVRCVCELQK